MAATPGQPGSSLIPLLWIPMKTVPPVAQAYQYKDKSLGDAYGRVGLRSLLRERRYRDDRHAFILALAERIVELNRTTRVAEAPDRPGFDDVRSAFGPAAAPAPRSGSRPAAHAEAHRTAPATAPSRKFDHLPRLNATPFTPEDDSR
jgi:hypothetical protein